MRVMKLVLFFCQKTLNTVECLEKSFKFDTKKVVEHPKASEKHQNHNEELVLEFH
jgi:hypothetical protein